MKLNMLEVRRSAIQAMKEIFEDTESGFSDEIDKETNTLILRVNDDVNICGYDMAIDFMFTTKGNFFATVILDEIEFTVENAALAFDVSSTTMFKATIDEDDFLCVELSSYMFREEDAYEMIVSFFGDFADLIQKDESMKSLLDAITDPEA